MKIKSIKKINNTSKKYDISVRENNNFFANGILVHNCSIYPDYCHARSIDSKNHQSRDWARAFWSNIQHNVPEGWRVVCENLYAKHSIAYDNLKSYLYGIFVWNDKNECLSWDETLEWFELLGIVPVDVLYDGIYNEKMIKSLWTPEDGTEGYVIRKAVSFHYNDFRNNVAKFVRKNHITTGEHWMHQEIVPNKLKDSDEK